MPPTYSPFWKPFEILARLGLGRRRLALGEPTMGEPYAADVTGGTDWRAYAEPELLYDLWGPPHASPWSGYHRPTLFAALDSLQEVRRPGGVPGFDAASAPRGPPAWLDGRTAVLLDLPGPVSVAYAAHLLHRGGMAPVVTFNNWPHARGVIDAGRALAALLHYAPWVKEGWDRVEDRNAAPPVFVADSTRMGSPIVKPKDFDNRYFLLETDLPSGATLAARGIERLVYVRPALPPDAPPPIPPRPDDADDLNAYLHETSKRVRIELARASVATWGMGAPAPFPVTVRKTPFSTTRDPAFKGFRRNAAGGFGVLVPEPSSGGG